jgi:hypothetical protein
VAFLTTLLALSRRARSALGELVFRHAAASQA